MSHKRISKSGRIKIVRALARGWKPGYPLRDFLKRKTSRMSLAG